MIRSISIPAALLTTTLLLSGCPDPDGPAVAEGIFAPLGEPLPSATDEQREIFARGREVAERRFTPAEGLGPEFNVTFCGACHEKPVTGGSAGRYRNFLLVGERLSDGSFNPLGKSGVQTHYTLADGGRAASAEGANNVATRNPVPFFGVGLLAELPEESILRYADPDDADGDGISGRPNYDRGFIGRFGRKSQTVSIEGFIRGPLFNHAGITSNPLPDALKARLPVPSATDVGATRGALGPGEEVGRVALAQAAAPEEPILDDDGVPDPELSEEDLFALVSFSMLLAAPEPDPPTAETERGRALFAQVNCSGCHVPALEGPRGLVPAYTDLLLHDMGPELGDGVVAGVATGTEFRTQPLWGIAAVGPYLHDGRADTVDEAIRMHGGEAEASREAYLALDAVERSELLAFLDSLGGRSQRTAGLLPPEAPVPVEGELGCPDAPLDGAELARFLRGREIFDGDFAIARGLGPLFNGDACRACHFDPVIGGAGPADVDVTRQGIVGTSGGFVYPEHGTMAHRHSVLSERPPTDPAANLFETRQTPALFGLGLVERIPEATILALEDPDDLDGDGVSGRAHVLPDGRLGRLGWKANVPSLAEFSRDAMSNELGVSLPAVAGHTFGFLSDDDDAPDPEISVEELEALTFFMQRLAPPPRRSTDPAAEAAGEALFDRVGCAACHVPSLDTADGTPVPLYSDLLLHDVAPEGALGVPDGDASARELRTPPLWGISSTAPYMHDGRAFTLEDAIARHESEGEASRRAYEALAAEERAQLLAFLRSL